MTLMFSLLLQTSGRGSGTPSQREHELQKENLKLSTENLELRFQLEQANKDLPRLKVQLNIYLFDTFYIFYFIYLTTKQANLKLNVKC